VTSDNPRGEDPRIIAEITRLSRLRTKPSKIADGDRAHHRLGERR